MSYAEQNARVVRHLYVRGFSASDIAHTLNMRREDVEEFCDDEERKRYRVRCLERAREHLQAGRAPVEVAYVLHVRGLPLDLISGLISLSESQAWSVLQGAKKKRRNRRIKMAFKLRKDARKGGLETRTDLTRLG